MAQVKAPPAESFFAKPGALVDLGLTLPVFLLYHAGVIFLGVRNGSDLLTETMLRMADGDTRTYLGMTAAVGVTFVGAYAAVGRGEIFAPRKFVAILAEASVYAAAMKFAVTWAVGRLFAGHIASGREAAVGLVMSLGAGFYEELAYRVLLFGVGAKALVLAFTPDRLDLVKGNDGLHWRGVLVAMIWAAVASALFSGAHYVGPLADEFKPDTFTFRALLNLALTLVFVTRGFAAAVWTHLVYDVWVLVLDR
jgi:hypothetical protein